MVEPFLQTKLHMPPHQPDWIEQPRLLDRLSQNNHSKLILVSAPAGYGKTTLIAEWVSRNAKLASNKPKTCWLSLDEDDSDPQLFFRYLAATVQPVLNGPSSLTQHLQQNQPSSAKHLSKVFIHDVAAVPHPFTLILDDYHMIDSVEIDKSDGAPARAYAGSNDPCHHYPQRPRFSTFQAQGTK